MNLKKCRVRINELMSEFVVQVKGENEMGMFDINRVSEDVLIPLLSEIYGHTALKNLNVSEGPNSPAIDLGDKETRTAYQITSTPSPQKIKQTLEKFVAHKRYEEYDCLVIYILTEKQGEYQGKGFDEIVGGQFSFEKEEDIRDYRDLLKEISGFPLEKTRRVANILEQHFGEKRNYSFGELELDMNWFKIQFNKQMAAVGKKFSSILHTETRADTNVHALLGDTAFAHQIAEWIEKLEEKVSELKEAIDDLKRPVPNEIEWNEEEKSKVIRASESLQDALVKVMVQLKQSRKFLEEKRLSEAQTLDLGFAQLEAAFDTYRTVGREYGTSRIKYTGENGDEERVLREIRGRVHHPDSLVANLLDKFFLSVIRQCGLIKQSDLHILGKAGIGKTHIACNICDDRLNSGLPALFVRGNLFTNDRPIEEQLMRILDIPPSYSWHDFLQVLSVAAEAYHTRIPLIIDGLNESTHNGAFSNVWRLGLKGLIHEISETKNVVLITTYRTSYKEAIWGEEDPSNEVGAYGFDTDEVKQEAIDKYFNAYKIVADPTLGPLMQFEHPLHLKIFCETKNSERKTEKQVYVGEQTLFEVFKEYLEQCNRAICERFELHPAAHIVQSALSKMAAYLWEHRSRYIPLEELVCMVDHQTFDKLIWSSSKTYAIEDEGLLLVYRDWVEGVEVVRFTYDLLGGYLIARYLVQEASKHRQSCLRRIVSNLFGKERYNSHPLLSDISKYLLALFPAKIRGFLHNLWGNKTEHPLSDDIGRCLAALLPAEKGQFLHELSENKKAFDLSIDALFEISPQDISEECIKLVTDLFERHQQNRKRLFGLAKTTIGHPDHPFRASFWSDRLSALSMVERDLSWSEYVRRNRESLEKTVMRFEETCQSEQDLSNASPERLHLMAEYIMWMLTSTVRPLRDKATRALYWYGRCFPQKFFELVMGSLSINDPYVPERMLAATYGIAMARQYDFKDTSFAKEILPLYGRQLYEFMFKLNALHSTTHILARNYARRTIDIALIHHPDLLTADERKNITPPFTKGGIREWGESENRDADQYQKGPAPLQMDFKNYTLRQLVKFNNRDPDEYKRVERNIYWRIYDLGYSLDSFGGIDGPLVGENYRKYSRSADGRKTDRYGKKYSWIAFYELAGFRQDKGFLSDYYDEVFILEADIDPSFPDAQREYELIKEDFLGDQEVSAAEWISKTSLPDLTPYLKVNNLCAEQGPWVLLKGYLRQKDNQANRDMLTFLRGLIVNSEETEEIVETLKQQEKIDGHTIPSYLDYYYTYAGEIPWCDTYPENSWEEVSFKVGSVLGPEEQQVLLRNGEPVSDEEIQEFCDSIADLIETEDPSARLLGFWGINSIADLVETRSWGTIEAQLHERGFALATETVEVEQPEYQTFEILVPLRENSWEDSQSAAIPGRNVAIPSKQIAEAFSLHGQPQSYDLFEKDGMRASMTFRCGEEWGEMQDFAYLRADLLERYLTEIGGKLIWVMWGEQCVVPSDEHTPYKFFQDVKVYRKS